MPCMLPADLQHSYSCQTNGADGSEAQRKKSRGFDRGMAVEKLPPGKKFPLRINRLGQPYGSHSKDLSCYLEVLARDLDKAPLIYHTWIKLPTSYKDDVWIRVKNKFELPDKRDLPETFRCYVMDSFRKKWSDWRSILWNIYYIHGTKDARLQACPKEIPQDQWKSLMGYFDYEKSKSTNANDGIDVARLDMWINAHRIVRCSSRKVDAVPIFTRLSNQASQKPADALEAPNHSSDVVSQKLLKNYAACARISGHCAHAGGIDGSKPSKQLLVMQNEALEQRVRHLEQFMEAQGWRKDDA